MSRREIVTKADRLRLAYSQALKTGGTVVVPIPMPAWYALAVIRFASGYLGALAWRRYLDAHGSR